MLLVKLQLIHVPAGSTIGFGVGVNEDGDPVRFAGDARMMAELGECLVAHGDVYAEVPEWAQVDAGEASDEFTEVLKDAFVAALECAANGDDRAWEAANALAYAVESGGG